MQRSVVALAGRRIDAPGEAPRFPLSEVPRVRLAVAARLRRLNAVALVCSAACGADLLALEAAEQLGLRRRIVLPFAAERFRLSSVVDRPGNWAKSFDRLVAQARADGELVVLEGEEGDEAYAAANTIILSEARSIAEMVPSHRLVALSVWEGFARPGYDATDGFRLLARAAGFKTEDIPIL